MLTKAKADGGLKMILNSLNKPKLAWQKLLLLTPSKCHRNMPGGSKQNPPYVNPLITIPSIRQQLGSESIGLHMRRIWHRTCHMLHMSAPHISYAAYVVQHVNEIV